MEEASSLGSHVGSMGSGSLGPPRREVFVGLRNGSARRGSVPSRGTGVVAGRQSRVVSRITALLASGRLDQALQIIRRLREARGVP
jgi:hypothetical protein